MEDYRKPLVLQPGIDKEMLTHNRKRRAAVVSIISCKVPGLKNDEYAAARINEAMHEACLELYAGGWRSTSTTHTDHTATDGTSADDTVNLKGSIGLDYFEWLTDAKLWARYEQNFNPDDRTFPYEQERPEKAGVPVSGVYLRHCRWQGSTASKRRKLTPEEATPVAKRLRHYSSWVEPRNKEEWSTQAAWRTLYSDESPPVTKFVFNLALDKTWERLAEPGMVDILNASISRVVKVNVYDTLPNTKTIGVMFTSHAQHKVTRHLRQLHEVWVMLRRWHAGLGAGLHFMPVHQYFVRQQELALEREISEAVV
ncbi:hypothetical protein QBC41DRAFT_305876 [Cercophora samala]|uniref:Uncharacterized protein n=1 Tax=Cercophora samala TaxID=330535 RepID=A0AA39Z8N3_9PEZI|nr:hypothetical protein QBC41DRAFT_305876 [Cercophora samala]